MKNFIDFKDYRIKIIKELSSDNLIDVKITHKKTGLIGFGCFYFCKNNLIPVDIFINKEHQRKGLGTMMYSFVEKYFQIKIKPSERQSDDAVLFCNQKNRPFG